MKYRIMPRIHEKLYYVLQTSEFGFFWDDEKDRGFESSFIDFRKVIKFYSISEAKKFAVKKYGTSAKQVTTQFK